MINLSHLVGPWPPTSQAAGNTTSDASAAMTAPGSSSETAPEPRPWPGLDVGPQRTTTVMHPSEPPAPDSSPWSGTSKTWVQASPDESAPGGNLTQLGRWRQS